MRSPSHRQNQAAYRKRIRRVGNYHLHEGRRTRRTWIYTLGMHYNNGGHQLAVQRNRRKRNILRRGHASST